MYCSDECRQADIESHECEPPVDWITMAVYVVFKRYSKEIFGLTSKKLFNFLKTNQDKDLNLVKKYYGNDGFLSVFAQFIKIKKHYTINLNNEILKFFKFDNNDYIFNKNNPLSFFFIIRINDLISGKRVVNHFSMENLNLWLKRYFDLLRENDGNYILHLHFLYDLKDLSFNQVNKTENILYMNPGFFGWFLKGVDNWDDYKFFKDSKYFSFSETKITIDLIPEIIEEPIIEDEPEIIKKGEREIVALTRSRLI